MESANIISDVSGPVEEEEEVGLTGRKKSAETVIKSVSDLNLTSDIAQVKCQEVKERSDMSEPVETKASWLKINSGKPQDQKKKKSHFGSLGTSLYKESSMLTRIRTQGTRGKKAYDTTGLGHWKEKL